MIHSMRKSLLDKICSTVNFQESKSRRMKNNDQCFASKKTSQSSKEDLLLGDSFANIPISLPPKFDSKADLLMDQINNTPEQDSFDCQQLLLKSCRNPYSLRETEPLSNQEVIQQLQQLSDLLNRIISEYTLSGNYSSSFLREIIHNICLDLNVLLLTLDNQVKAESNC